MSEPSRNIQRGGKRTADRPARSEGRFTGVVVDWNVKRGFGFVRPDNVAERTTSDLFLHINDIRNSFSAPRIGSVVSYKIQIAPDGRGRAVAVDIVGTSGFKKRKGWDYVVVPISVLQGFAIAASSYLVLGGICLILNFVTFAAYAVDKRAAQTDNGRIAEHTLLLLGMLGGWPGGVLAQQIFRHKTRKVSFQILFWISVIINIVGICLIAMSAGSSLGWL